MKREAAARSEASARRELDRVGAFSDGVFAVAITLLVLNIEVPDVGESELGTAIDELLPDIQSYLIAFAVIGLFWYGHHIAWSRFKATTPKLVWANLLLLALIVLMPFTTALVSKFGGSLAVAIYAGNVGLAALADTLVDRIAWRSGLTAGVNPAEAKANLTAGWLRSGVFFLSVPLAWVSPTLAQLSWLLLFLTSRLARRAIGSTPTPDSAA